MAEPRIPTQRDAERASNYMRSHAQAENWPRMSECADVMDALAADLAAAQQRLRDAMDDLTLTQQDLAGERALLAAAHVRAEEAERKAKIDREQCDEMTSMAGAAHVREQTLRDALTEIANGPWPDGFIADAQRVSRAALASTGEPATEAAE